MRGGKRDGAGRPKGSVSPDSKTTYIRFRLDPETKQAIQKRAKERSESMSEYLINLFKADIKGI